MSGQNLADRTAYLKQRLGSYSLINQLAFTVDNPASTNQLDTPDLGPISTIYCPFAVHGLGNAGNGIAAGTNSTPVQITTNAPHGLGDLSTVFFSNLAGAGAPAFTGLNWQIHVIDALNFQLVGSTASGAITGGQVSLSNLYSFAGHIQNDQYHLTLQTNFFLDVAGNAQLVLLASEVPTGQVAAAGQPSGNFSPTRVRASSKLVALGNAPVNGGTTLNGWYNGNNRSGSLYVGVGVLIPGDPTAGIHRAQTFGDFSLIVQQFRST